VKGSPVLRRQVIAAIILSLVASSTGALPAVPRPAAAADPTPSPASTAAPNPLPSPAPVPEAPPPPAPPADAQPEQPAEPPAESPLASPGVVPDEAPAVLTDGSAPTTVVGYGSGGWRYLQVPQGGGGGYQVPGFDDSAWPTGPAPFRSGGACPLQATVPFTSWATNTDMLVRRHIALPAGTQGVAVWVAIDNDIAEIFWNGVSIGSNSVHEGCATVDSRFFAVDPANVIADNVLAIRARDRGVESYLDIRVVSGGIPAEPAGEGVERTENQATGGDPVGTFHGQFTYSFTDLAIPGRGPAPVFARSYSSADPRVGPMGIGWTHTYNARLRDTGDGSGDLLFVRPSGATDRFRRNNDETFSPSPAELATLVRNADLTYTVTEKDQTRWTFDQSGALTAITDRHGNTSTLTYNAAGELVSVSDPAGRGSLTLGYTSGKLTSVTDWASPARTVSYAYDANGRLWTVTDREGKVTTFGYDGTSSRLTSITDARGNVALSLTYDASGRVATQKDAGGLVTGATTTFGYVANGDGSRVTTVTSPPTSFEPAFSPTIVDTYNASGWLTSRVTRPSSSETLTESYGYDANGFRSSVTDPRGNTTNFCYDVSYAGSPIAGSRGNLTRVIGPAPTAGANRPVTLMAYDARSNVTQTVAPRGVPSGASVTCSTNLSAINTSYATDLAYDAAGAALLSVTRRSTDPDTGATTAVTTYEYGDAANPGAVTRIIPPRGNTGGSPDYSYATTFAYFATGSRAGMLERVTDPLGNATTYDYDPVGRLISSVDPLGNAAGGVPAEHRTELTYDNEDRVRFVKLPAPTAGGTALVTETRYDEVGNPVVRIDAAGQVTTYAYDVRDALFQVKESPNAWTDPASPPSGVITTEYAYDAAGNLTRMTRAKGDVAAERVTDYAYDGRGLVRRETQYPSWPTTTPTLVASSTYDPNGNLSVATDQLNRTTSFGYDALNRLTGIDYSDPGTADASYGYDANDNRTSMTDGTGATSYTYDELDRLLSVTTPGPKTVGYRYDRDGNRTKLIYPDGTAVSYTFDTAARMTGLTDWASRTVGYTYEPDGALRTATNPNGSVATYAYDNARRLTAVNHTLGSTTIAAQAYGLDSVGNVIAMDDGVPTPLTTARASIATGGAQGNGAADNPAVSADGRYVAFASAASNLVAGDTNARADVFVRDTVTGTTSRVSITSGGVQGDGDSDTAAISGDGRYVVFESWATNLAPGDTNGAQDIYLHDRQTGTTERVSVSSAGAQGTANSWWPSITPDARYVVFESDAPNLVAGDTNGQNDIFVRDRQTSTTSRVSVASDGTQANAISQVPSVSADGRYIVFASAATNLVPGDTNTTHDIFVHDRETATTTRVSESTTGTLSNNLNYWPSISADGRYVAFLSYGSNLVAGDTNDRSDVFVRDRRTGATSRVSVSSAGAQATDGSGQTQLSADGRYVAFESAASNLVAGDTNAVQDVFVRDRLTGSTSRVSVASGGTQANAESQDLGLSADGRVIAYESAATTLVASDTNAVNDAFVTDRGVVSLGYGYDTMSRLTLASDPAAGLALYSYDPVGNRLSRSRDNTSYAYDRADRLTQLSRPATTGASTRPPSSNDAGWTNGANAYASDNVYATTAPNKNQTRAVLLGNFGFDSTIPAGATINSVTVSVEWKVSTTASVATLGAGAWVNGAAYGSELVNTAEPTTDTTQTFTVSGLSRAQLLNGTFGVRVRASRGNSNTGFTASLDAVSVAVTYTASGSQAVTVSAVGVTTARGADSFAYDQANRLTSATVAGLTETSTYDGDGVRVSRQVGGGPLTRYVTDPAAAGLPVTIDDGTRKYVWGLGLAYAVSGTGIEVYHADRLGSVRALTDAAGSVIATYRSDEFGIPVSSTGSSSQPFRYTGEPSDASGLTYLRARFYDPSLGRFMSRDPFGGFASAPLTLNRYSYVENNPATLVDLVGTTPSSAVLQDRRAEPRPEPGPDPGLYLAKGGKQNIRDSGLRDVPDEEVSRRARDPNLTPQERQRYIREEKARGLRNRERRSNFEVDPLQPAVTAVVAGAGATAAYVVYRGIRLLPSLLPPLWGTLLPNLLIP